MKYDVDKPAGGDGPFFLRYQYNSQRVTAGTFGPDGFRYIKGSVGRDGKRLEVPLEVLPAEAQTACHSQHGSFPRLSSTGSSTPFPGGRRASPGPKPSASAQVSPGAAPGRADKGNGDHAVLY